MNNNEPCRFDDNLTCLLKTCTRKCPKNIYHNKCTIEENINDTKID